MKAIAVIPARYGSTRLPGKPLVKLLGKELLLHVIDRALGSSLLSEVIVATDDERVMGLALSYGVKAVMTPSNCASGTDRVALVAKEIDCDIVVNLQVDDPTIRPQAIDMAIKALLEDPLAKVSTLCKKIERETEILSPHVVKVVFDKNYNALYFSRSPIPYERNKGAIYYKHIGPYVFRREFIFTFTSWEPTYLERIESLEQLRILENGYRIKLVEVFYESVEVDTPEDIPLAEEALKRYNSF
ncbi:MAG: 3-deoxy-manno-octulosonate cytidylyltransferase [Synergistetes bacterium]|nr:3-deoxy-manno-octulosonate cytidylyltransferase [Synergistota bacterium]MDW8193108.1 3-deoxy-manno-octulosonate cytidylyltransferase [Synergistota bacterium]